MVDRHAIQNLVALPAIHMPPFERSVLALGAVLIILFLLRYLAQATALRLPRGEVVAVMPGTATAVLLQQGVYAALVVTALLQRGGVPATTQDWLALGVLSLGIALRTVALSALKARYSRRTLVYASHRLARSGIYARLRHPLALGLLIEYVSFLLLSPNPLTLALACAGAAVLATVNSREESFLIRHLGTLYEDHVRRTWDWTDVFIEPVRARRKHQR